MKSRLALAAVMVAGVGFVDIGAGSAGATAAPTTQCAPTANYPAATTAVAFWSTEARCAIIPAGPGGAFGSENFGNKFPGDAAVYMGIVHVSIYDAAVSITGGYKPYAATPRAPAGTSPRAAIATAAYDTLTGLQPLLGASQTILDTDYAAYMAAIPDGTPKQHGIAVGDQAAQAVLALRANDGRGCTTTLADLGLPAPGPGVWEPEPGAPLLGLCLPGMRPLGLRSASQFRPDGPNALTSRGYTADFNQVKSLGSADSTTRPTAPTTQALFWTDNNTREWNDGMLRLAAARGLSLVQTARMLAMAHVAGADAQIACFDAKYHSWFWRPDHAIPQADTDGNPNTVADASWTPLQTTPNFPEYPSAHACNSTAFVAALRAFFGTGRVALTLDSRAPGLPEAARTRTFHRLRNVVKNVDMARVLVGFHFRNSTLDGSILGRRVTRYITHHYFQPLS
jgi:hypothetical protein